MEPRILVIRVASGEGFLKDEDFAAWENLDEECIAELVRHYELAAVGSILDYLDLDALQELAGRAEPVVEADLAGMEPRVQGAPLKPGVAYGLLLGGEERLAAHLVHRLLQEQIGADRVVAASRDSAFRQRAETPLVSTGAKMERAPRVRPRSNGGNERAASN